MKHSYLFKYISIASLLFALPLAMLGQTSASWMAEQKRHLPKYESEGWGKLVLQGGVLRTRDGQNADRRTGRYYLRVPYGLASLLNMDYVNGYSVGPQLTLGYVDNQYGRWEVDVHAKYATSRHAWMYQSALRYVLPPEYLGSVEVFAQRFTTDFDADALMPRRYQLLASGVFGWNGFKLYQNQSVGLRGQYAVAGDWQLGGALWYEDRLQLENHRKRNLFGMVGQDNYPRVRGHRPEEVVVSDPLLNWGSDHLMRAQVELSYCPGRKLLVLDDMHVQAQQMAPTVTLRAEGGWDDAQYRFLSLEGRVTQRMLALPSRTDWLSYYGAAGWFPCRKEVQLADWKHFDASHYLWQTQGSLTWFALLTNYELSTQRAWVELHGEWLSEGMLLGRLASAGWLREYVQAHGLAVQEHRPHAEFAYGLELVQQIRLGVCAGFDGSTFDGWALQLIWDLSKQK